MTRQGRCLLNFDGVQQKVSELLDYHVSYILCQVQRLNNVIENCCNSSFLIVELFNVLKETFVFFASSTKRFAAIKQTL